MDQSKEKPVLFTTEQILEVSGTSLPSLKEILRLGLITPAQPSEGKRQRNLYQFKDAVLVKTVKLLSEEEYPRKLIFPLAFGAGEMVMQSTSNPLSLQFAPFPQRKGLTLNEYPPVLLKLINYRTFYKVGFQNVATGTFDFRFIKVGKKLKSLSQEDLSTAEQTRCSENSYDYSNTFTLVVNMTAIHLGVKLKLMGMGLI